MTEQPIFLSAEWRALVMLNFSIDPGILEKYVPRQTQLDSWDGTSYVSLVAFLFLQTRVKGIAVPFHRNFEEINLRFYVRREAGEGIRRGVVFVREVVPRRAIAAVARWIYKENYVACPTRSRLRGEGPGGQPAQARYEWKHEDQWLSVGATYYGDPVLPGKKSEEEFITEHYWGYVKQPDDTTVEYRVEHPQWPVWPAQDYTLEGDFGRFYGPEFGPVLRQTPTSVFVAKGSPVSVRGGRKLK